MFFLSFMWCTTCLRINIHTVVSPLPIHVLSNPGALDQITPQPLRQGDMFGTPTSLLLYFKKKKIGSYMNHRVDTC